jgi:hypothetical protein
MAVSPIRWLRQLIPPLIAAMLLLASATSAGATGNGYHAYTNVTAFAYACDRTSDTYSAQLGDLAEDGLEYLGYYGVQYRSGNFNTANVIAGATYQHDVAFYVHTHGDYYGPARIQGIRVDDGYCTGAPIVNSHNIDAVRYNPPTNQAYVGQVVIFSTCFLGENPPAGTDQLSMSEAWGIAQNKTMTSTFGFFMGYSKEPFTSDERAFEGKFWSKVKAGGATFKAIYTLADAFTWAKANTTFSTPAGKGTPAPQWYGNPNYTGWWDTRPGCVNCH